MSRIVRAGKLPDVRMDFCPSCLGGLAMGYLLVSWKSAFSASVSSVGTSKIRPL